MADRTETDNARDGRIDLAGIRVADVPNRFVKTRLFQRGRADWCPRPARLPEGADSKSHRNEHRPQPWEGAHIEAVLGWISTF